MSLEELDMPGWLKFEPVQGLRSERKTGIWRVGSQSGGLPLGEVRWLSGWRKYAFYPAKGSAFEADCLRELANFCERVTREHWRGVKLSKAAARAGDPIPVEAAEWPGWE
jgi:hypothetical protein